MKVFDKQGKEYNGEPVDCRELMQLHGYTLTSPTEAKAAEDSAAKAQAAADKAEKDAAAAAFKAKAEADRAAAEEKKAADDKAKAEAKAEAKLLAEVKASAAEHTIPQLMELLAAAEIDFDSAAKKADLVELYVPVLLKQTKEILAAAK